MRKQLLRKIIPHFRQHHFFCKHHIQSRLKLNPRKRDNLWNTYASFYKFMQIVFARCINTGQVYDVYAGRGAKISFYVCSRTTVESIEKFNSLNYTYVEMNPLEYDFTTYQMYCRVADTYQIYPVYVGKVNFRKMQEMGLEGVQYLRDHISPDHNINSFSLDDIIHLAPTVHPKMTEEGMLLLTKAFTTGVVNYKAQGARVYLYSARTKFSLIM